MSRVLWLAFLLGACVTYHTDEQNWWNATCPAPRDFLCIPRTSGVEACPDGSIGYYCCDYARVELEALAKAGNTNAAHCLNEAP